MFEDSLMESAHHISTRRGWTALCAATLQSLALAAMVLYPLLHPEILTPHSSTSGPTTFPAVRVVTQTQPDAAANASVVPAPVTVRQSFGHRADLSPHALVGPPAIDLQPTAICLLNCKTSDAIVSSGLPSLAKLSSALPQGPVSISHLDEGQVLHRVPPAYPQTARDARIQGAVVLQAIIGKNGSIENLHPISGSPLLVGAAKQAVSQWKFRPYLLNGRPIEVETQITVNFVLAGRD